MLDGWVRKKIDPILNRIAKLAAGIGFTPNMITVSSCVVGLIAAASIASNYYWPGLVLLLISRLGDGLDGAVARITGKPTLADTSISFWTSHSTERYRWDSFLQIRPKTRFPARC